MRHHHFTLRVWLPVAVAVLWVCASPAPALDVYLLDSGLTPAQVENQPYSYYVRQCADTLMQYGTDRYGAVQTPLLMSVIDVRNRAAPQSPMSLDEFHRAERRGRRNPGGSNLWMDQETLGVMYDLGQKTGEAKYTMFANNYINYYTTNVVNANKGLINWGWHEYYDAYNDVKTSADSNHHEIHYQQGHWAMLAAVNPTAITNEINGIWQYHVVNKTTGEINRHDDGDNGYCTFAFTGGTILSSFAYEYQQTGNLLWRDRAELVANYFWNRRNTTTNLIATTPNLGASRFDSNHFDTTVTGLYVGCLLDAYQQTNDSLFRNQAVAYLKAYAQYGYDDVTGKWWGSLNLDGTHVPGPNTITDPNDYDAYEARGYIDLWQPDAGLYARPLETAITYARAAKLTGDPALLQAAQRWANFISQSLPAGPCSTSGWYAEYARDWGQYGTYAENYGKTIDFFADMAELTDDPKYVALARSVADDAVSKLYYNGLFRGHPCTPYYESFDGVGDLLGALSRLDVVLVPEPGQIVLLATGLLGLLAYTWKQRR